MAPLLAITGCGLLDPADRLPAGEVPIQEMVDGSIDVAVSPGGIAPLSAEATFRSRTSAGVKVTVLGAEPVTHEVPGARTDHKIPILGLYPGTENRVVLEVATPGGTYAVDTLRIETEPLPDLLPDIEVVAADPDRMEDGWTLSSFSAAGDGEFISYPIIFDTNGDIRWYLDLSELGSLVYMVERLENGNLVAGHAHSIYEWDMLGRVVNEWVMPGYWFHHDVIEKPDGNFIVAVDKGGLDTVEDHVIEIDRSSGAIVREWDLREVLDVARRTYPGATDRDWFHMNAVWHDESDGGLILSGRNQSALVKVTEDNELLWILAGQEGWGAAGVDGTGHDTSELLLTAVDASGSPYAEPVQMGHEDAPDFAWGWGQHAPLILPNGNIFLFDNGDARNFTTDGPYFSRGVEYEIDEAAMTVRQVWEYGKERGEEFYSSIISDVDHLPGTGNRLIMPGIIRSSEPEAVVTEVTYPEGEVVFEARIDFRNVNATDGLGWGGFDLVYRSERVSLW